MIILRTHFWKQQGWGITDGKLFVVAEMRSPPDELWELVESVLKPLGLVYGVDMVFLEEQLTRVAIHDYGPDPYWKADTRF